MPIDIDLTRDEETGWLNRAREGESYRLATEVDETELHRRSKRRLQQAIIDKIEDPDEDFLNTKLRLKIFGDGAIERVANRILARLDPDDLKELQRESRDELLEEGVNSSELIPQYQARTADKILRERIGFEGVREIAEDVIGFSGQYLTEGGEVSHVEESTLRNDEVTARNDEVEAL